MPISGAFSFEEEAFIDSLEEALYRMGSSELLCLSILLSAAWSDFLSRKTDELKRNQSLEKFLFDLSFDELPSNQLYESFLLRSTNAQARYYRQSEGPWKTIEEYFVEYYYTRELVPVL